MDLIANQRIETMMKRTIIHSDYLWGFLLSSLLLTMISGCGSSEASATNIWESDNNDWVEIKIERFTIAVLIADDPSQQPDLTKYQDTVALHFTLLCLVAPDDVNKVSVLLQDKKGQLSNEVIRTCRNTSLVDLADPEFRLVRAHLRDFTEDLVGPGLIKRYIFSGVTLERY
jgi:hypothetical protein